MKTENEQLVDTFLKEIKNHLPEWLKSNDEKVEDILLEISSHVWDSAQEIAGSDDPDPVSIKEAINRLGNPKEIAKTYKKRGTPKYFISEELWSIYTEVNCFLISIVFLLIVIVQVVLVEPDNFLQALTNGITTSYPIILTFIVIVTAIFVGLSYDGYLPKDLVPKDETKVTESDFFKPEEFLIGGLLGVLCGLFMIILPIDMINLFRIIVNLILGLFGYSPMAINSGYANISMELRIWLTLIGTVIVIIGAINLLRIKTKDIRFQFKMNIVLIITGLADFGLSLYLIANMHLFSEILPLNKNLLLFLAILGIIGTAAQLISRVYQNIKLNRFFEEK